MIGYLINVVVAIVFGVVANSRGKSWFGWALMGGVVYFIVDMIVVAVGNSMFGPVSFPDGYYMFFFISTLLDIGVMVAVGMIAFRNGPPHTTEISDKNNEPEPPVLPKS
jgi:uncharacterized membrane protein YhdT